LAAKLCRAIAASHPEVTASIGTACARLDDAAADEPQALLQS
jgi:hypothetical protein